MPIPYKNDFTVENFGKTLLKGNLIVRYDIIFPTSIDFEKKERVIEDDYRVLSKKYD